MKKHRLMRAGAFFLLVLCMLLCACANAVDDGAPEASSSQAAEDRAPSEDDVSNVDADAGAEPSKEGSEAAAEADQDETPASIRARLNITEDFHDEFIHGEKPARFQKYIVMHDTEGTGDAASVIAWWVSDGKHVASHFVVNTDGSIVQCVPLDGIAHHAGFGDAGHNELFGVEDESRDDKLGTIPIGPAYPDYGMNSYSVGIEIVHVGEDGEDYPQAQLEALDGLVAYIDAYYGFPSTIIDHKTWRTTNSDCSEQFQPYLKNLQETRTHDGRQ